MPVVAMCPYCRAGGVRAPNHAVGWTATCPRCHSSFTIVPEEKLPGVANPRPDAEPQPVQETRAHASAEDVTEPSPVLTAAPPLPRRAPAAATPAAVEQPQAGYGVSLVAVTLFGLGLLATLFPHGRLIGLSVVGLGLVLGLCCLAASGRAQYVGAAAVLLNLGAAAILLFFPGWLGLAPWRTADEPGGPKTPVAIGHGATSMSPAEWVDASAASWVMGDVQVSVRSAAVGPVELTGANGQKRLTKEPCLQLLVRVTNAGVERRVELSGWAAGLPAAPNEVVRLTDPNGKPLKAKSFEQGWEAPDRPKPGGLFPGKFADVLLLYEWTAPPPSAKADAGPPVGYLRLELPGSAVGVTEPVKFHIPGSFLAHRPGPRGVLP